MAGGESSSSPSSFTYDMFLNFRGEDTRSTFVSHLCAALKNRGINTFIDDEKLPKGDEITPSLAKAIEESRIAIPVLSENYASSSFCLDELAKIIEAKKEGQLVLPVFYKVDPSVVRKQTGTYGDALTAHENKFKFKDDLEKLHGNMERLQKWKMALKHVADLAGYHIKSGDGNSEHQWIEKIVEQVSTEIRRVALPVADHPVGLDSKVEKLISLLDVRSNDGVRVVGIYGIGGIGKTTLAVAIYNWIADHFADLSFEGLCFLENIREYPGKCGLMHLQKSILYELVGEKKTKLTSVRQGISMLKQRLQRKKVLLVLDDINQEEQLEALSGNLDWLGPGSRVIVTTRDIHLLSRYEDKLTYELGELNEKDALELLSWKAFKTSNVHPSYMHVLNDVVTYASGLPLALEVIGSHLVGKSIEVWKSALDQYKRSPHRKIQTILEVSLEALHEDEKKIFLDIACCFGGYGLTDLKEILCAHHGIYSVDNAIEVLVDKSLIKIYGFGWVTLHNLIQEMGREIVCKESLKSPGEHRRLWRFEDIVQIFEKDMGSDKIEMIHMDFPEFERVIEWDGDAFVKMRNLKTLIIRKAHFSQGAKHLPDSLKVLTWCKYPSHSLPPDFYPKEIVMLQLSGSRLISVGFLDKREFMSLTVMELDESNIEEIPDISGAPNLKKLTFEVCDNLIKVHESVGFLNKLEFLCARQCEKLSSLPPLRSTSLRALLFDLCPSLENFPEILGEMKGVKSIYGSGTSIKELPSSIENLTKLEYLAFDDCEMLLSIPSSIVKLSHLRELYFSGSKGLRFVKPHEGEDQWSSTVFPNAKKVYFDYCNISDESIPIVLAWFRNVVELDLSGNNFTVLPKSMEELCSLRELCLNHCKTLREIRGIPLSIDQFCAIDCTSLTASGISMLLNEEGYRTFHFAGSSIPKGFYHSSRQDSISFWFRNHLPPISLCVVSRSEIGRTSTASNLELIVDGNEVSSACVCCSYSVSTNYHVTISYTSIGRDTILVRSDVTWRRGEIRLVNKKGLAIKQIGMRVPKSSMEDISFTIPRCSRGCEITLDSSSDSSLANNISKKGGCELPSDSDSGSESDRNLDSDSSLDSNTTGEGDKQSDRAVPELRHPQTSPASQGPSFAELENIEAPFPTSSSGIVSGEELHKKTCCTVLPTTADESFKNQLDMSQDDDIEMEGFYASLDDETHIPSHSQDHLSTNAPDEEARQTLKIVQDFITNNDASVFLDCKQCNTMKSSLDYLSNLSSNDGLAEEVRALISEASGVFTRCSSDYIEVNMKIESYASAMLKVNKLKADLEDNKKRFKEVLALEKELLQKLAYLEESKKELVSDMTRKKKRDVFEEGKALKTEMDKLREEVSHWKHEQDLAKETKAKIKAEWSELGEKFRKIVVE